MAGYKGHRKPEDLGSVFPDPVTHWLGSKLVDEAGKKVLYARGLVDAAAGELKRWIKGGAVTQPSFYGDMRLHQVGDERVHVVDTTPMSIDWAPYGGAGMDTSIVAMSGEMDSMLAGEQVATGSTPRPALVRQRTRCMGLARVPHAPTWGCQRLAGTSSSSGAAPGAQPPASPAPAGLVRSGGPSRAQAPSMPGRRVVSRDNQPRRSSAAWRLTPPTHATAADHNPPALKPRR